MEPVMVLAPVDCRSRGLLVEVHPVATQSLPQQENATAAELALLLRPRMPALETSFVPHLQHVRRPARIEAPPVVYQATSALVEAPVSWLPLIAEARAARLETGASVALKIPIIPAPMPFSFAKHQVHKPAIPPPVLPSLHFNATASLSVLTGRCVVILVALGIAQPEIGRFNVPQPAAFRTCNRTKYAIHPEHQLNALPAPLANLTPARVLISASSSRPRPCRRTHSLRARPISHDGRSPCHLTHLHHRLKSPQRHGTPRPRQPVSESIRGYCCRTPDIQSAPRRQAAPVV